MFRESLGRVKTVAVLKSWKYTEAENTRVLLIQREGRDGERSMEH